MLSDGVFHHEMSEIDINYRQLVQSSVWKETAYRQAMEKSSEKKIVAYWL